VSAAGDVILQTQGLSKEFMGFAAVQDVNLSVRRGSVHALIGPNGAGKTTVFNLLTGFLQPSAGRIRFDGADITGHSPVQVARLGMVRSFQISATFPHLTVLENVRIALQRKLANSFRFWEHESRLDCLNARALQLLQAVDLADLAHRVTVELPYGRKRALEIATTLALDPQLMLLDEPTQGMGHEDVSRVVELIRQVARDRTILMVEHNLSVVETLSDVITVLQRGSVLAHGPYAQVSRDPRVLEAYVGVEA
jgi:branched-chain amino acid transport system ATP-binding protein